MPEPNSEEQVPELTEQQKYVNEKVAVLLDQIGDEYGESLTQQLVQRLDTTVSDFHEEVTNLLSELKEKSISRQERLRDAWQHRFDTPPPADVPETAPEVTSEEGSRKRRRGFSVVKRSDKAISGLSAKISIISLFFNLVFHWCFTWAVDQQIH